MILAKRSPWFHKFFQGQENHERCAVAFFNFSEKIIQTAIDVIYGKEIILPIKEKNRLTSFLSKLGVIWSEENMGTGADVTTAPKGSTEVDQAQSKKNVTNKAIDVSCKPPSAKKSSASNDDKSIGKHFNVESSNENDFYAVLDQFTETSNEELEKINHMLLGESGDPTRMYKCMKCTDKSKFFTQAEKHHQEHEFEAFRPVRETLRKAELDRQKDAQNLEKIEKGIGKIDKKTLIRALRYDQANLFNFLINLGLFHGVVCALSVLL